MVVPVAEGCSATALSMPAERVFTLFLPPSVSAEMTKKVSSLMLFTSTVCGLPELVLNTKFTQSSALFMR